MVLWKSGMRQTPARLNDPPAKAMCRLNQVAAGTVLNNNTNTALAWDGEDYDTAGLHSLLSNLSYVVISAAAGDGIYLCKGTVMIPARTDYQTVGCVIAKNGVNQQPWTREGPNAVSAQRSFSAEARLPLVVGDRVELVANQANGAAVAVTTVFANPAVSSFACVFEVEKIAALPS
jgi:hypothetical protein